MKNYRKHIDDFFREKLGAYTETPPPEVWDDLEKRLDGLTPSLTNPNRYRWVWHTAIVSVLLLLGVSMVRKISNNSASKNNDIALNSKTANNDILPGTSAASKNAPATHANAIATANADNNAGTNNNKGNAVAQPASLNGNAPAQSQNIRSNATSSTSSKTAQKNKPSQKQAARNKYPALSSGVIASAQVNSSKNTGAGTYSSKNPNPSPAEVETSEDNEVTRPSPNATLADAAKKVETAVRKQPAATPKTSAAAKNAGKKHNIGFNRFEAGVKAGYEGGFSDGAASKFVVSPYLQYNMSRKLSLMVQPAVKAATISSERIGIPQSYYKLNEDGKVTDDGSVITQYYSGGTVIDTYHTKYTYTQTHDSIVKSNTFRGTYAEFELPILLKYAITKRVSVYGGVNLIYSQLMGITENTYAKQGILRSSDTTVIGINAQGQAPQNVLTYTGTPYSDYKGPVATPANQLRIGYMLGFSYACSKKWLIDALVEQAPATPDVKGGYNINTPLSSTYFRLTIGYKLTK